MLEKAARSGDLLFDDAIVTVSNCNFIYYLSDGQFALLTSLPICSLCSTILHVQLHRCGYNVVEATKMMQANDQHLTSDSSFMSSEDVKKFGKGIKTYGKNFNRISKELIPLHQRVCIWCNFDSW